MATRGGRQYGPGLHLSICLLVRLVPDWHAACMQPVLKVTNAHRLGVDTCVYASATHAQSL